MTVPPDPFRPPEDPVQQQAVPGPPPYAQPAPYGYPPYGQAPPYGHAPYGGYPAPRSTNGFAIASLVLGVVWVFWIGSVLALIFGYIARDQIRRTGEHGDGLAIAGIVLGWVGVGMLVFYVIALIAVIPA
jgi:hypothetical protein